MKKGKILKRASLTVIVLVLATVFLSGCGPKDPLAKASKNLTTYNITATLDTAKMEVTATQDVLYVNNEDVPLSELCFNLYPNAYREGAVISPIDSTEVKKAYPNGQKTYGSIDVASVKAADAAVSFTVGGEDSNILSVPIAELFPGEKVTVSMAYTVKIPQVKHRLGYGDYYVNLGNWYPILCVYENGAYRQTPYYSNGDPFYSDCANYNVTFTAPSAYLCAMTGSSASTTASGMNTYTSSQLVARDFAIVALKDSKMVTKTVDGVAINYYYHNDDAADASLKVSEESLTTFNGMFGKYPYASLSVVQTGFLAGGMEYPGLVFIADDLSAEGYQETIVHEIAHQWWYASVGSDQVNQAWQDEGLTEYSTVLFYEKNPQYNVTRSQFMEKIQTTVRNFASIYAKVTGVADMSMNRPVNKYGYWEYVYLTYDKGAMLFDSLRTTLGEDKFYKAMQAYYKDNQFKHATPATLVYALERTGGVSVEGMVASWIDGTAMI